jgi:polyhydroxyalkanoate synthesis regulator protein
MKIIKRYKNRRLYDTDLKKYITHQELAAIVRLDIPFRIIENATGQDITLPVLGQLLAGELKGRPARGGTKRILIEAINRGGKQSMAILKNTFLAGVGIVNLTKKKAEEVIDSLIKAGQIHKSDRKEAVMELLDKAEASTAKMAEKVKKETSGWQKEVKKISDRIKQLADKLPQKRIIADLERLNKKVDELAKKINEKK